MNQKELNKPFMMIINPLVSKVFIKKISALRVKIHEYQEEGLPDNLFLDLLCTLIYYYIACQFT